MCKKLVFLVMLLGFASVASAGNAFEGDVDTSWSLVDNWSMNHVPNDSTTDPSVYVPQWGNAVEFTINNAAMEIGTGEDWHCYAFQLGTYGADNTSLTMSGGSLTAGGWGMDVGRGETAVHGTGDGTLTMTGGTITTTAALTVPQEWGNTGALGTITGLVNASGGTINANFMRIGMYDGPGTVNLSGTVVVNLAELLQMNVGWGGWDEPDSTPSAALDISGNAVLNIGGQGGGTPEDLEAELQTYQDYIDLGWITANGGLGTVVMTYDAGTDMITLVPEPATIVLLGLGGLALVRRKR